jgi:hypothetical protein
VLTGGEVPLFRGFDCVVDLLQQRIIGANRRSREQGDQGNGDSRHSGDLMRKSIHSRLLYSGASRAVGSIDGGVRRVPLNGRVLVHGGNAVDLPFLPIPPIEFQPSPRIGRETLVDETRRRR